MSLLWHPDSPGLLWPLSMDPNCCCADLPCPCLSGPLTASVAIPTIPPVVQEIPWPCHQIEALFFGAVPICITANGCKHSGRQYHTVYNFGPPATAVDACAVAPGDGCCQEVDLWIPDPNDPTPADCKVYVPISCPFGDAFIGDNQEYILEIDCSNPSDIIARVTYNYNDACGFTTSWVGTKSLGPSPADPLDALDTYILAPPGQTPPLPDVPYGNMRWLAQRSYDLRNGYQVTIA